jgi:hypothetical protein
VLALAVAQDPLEPGVGAARCLEGAVQVLVVERRVVDGASARQKSACQGALGVETRRVVVPAAGLGGRLQQGDGVVELAYGDISLSF